MLNRHGYRITIPLLITLLLLVTGCLSSSRVTPAASISHSEITWSYERTVQYAFDNRIEGVYSVVGEYQLMIIRDGRAAFFIRTVGPVDTRQLNIIGSFNNWDDPGIPMKNYRNRFWYAVIEDATDTYENYMFFNSQKSKYAEDKIVEPACNPTYIDYPFGPDLPDWRLATPVEKISDEVRAILVEAGVNPFTKPLSRYDPDHPR